jgi:hypothetical protein
MSAPASQSWLGPPVAVDVVTGGPGSCSGARREGAGARRGHRPGPRSWPPRPPGSSAEIRGNARHPVEPTRQRSGQLGGSERVDPVDQDEASRAYPPPGPHRRRRSRARPRSAPPTRATAARASATAIARVRASRGRQHLDLTTTPQRSTTDPNIPGRQLDSRRDQAGPMDGGSLPPVRHHRPIRRGDGRRRMRLRARLLVQEAGPQHLPLGVPLRPSRMRANTQLTLVHRASFARPGAFRTGHERASLRGAWRFLSVLVRAFAIDQA